MPSPKLELPLHVDVTDKPDSQHSDKLKEDEVSSSEEAFKSDSVPDYTQREGKQTTLIRLSILLALEKQF